MAITEIPATGEPTVIPAPGGGQRVLLIEDSPSDAMLVRAMLSRQNATAPECVVVETLAAGLASLADAPPTCVLVDLGLPDSDGLSTLDAVVGAAPDIPVVILTGFDDDRLGEDAVGHGAQDYLVKGRTDAQLLFRTIRHATERKRAELVARRSDSYFRSLLDVAPDAIIACDVDRTITFWNRGAESTYGWSATEAVGRQVQDLISDDGAHAEARAHNLSSAGEWQGEARHRRKDGREIVIEGRWSVLRDEAGEPVGLLGANRDVSARRAIEDQLAESQARLADLVDIAPDPIISMDGDQRVTVFNQSAETVFGFRAEEVLGQPLDVLLPEAAASRHRGHIEGFIGEEKRARRMNERGEVFGRRKDGTTFPAEASISKLSRDGRVTFTVILRDVSARKEAESALRDSEARLTAILDTLPVAVIVARAGGDVAYVNRRARQFVGDRYQSDCEERIRARARAFREGTANVYPPEEIPIVRALRGEEGTVSDLEFELGGTRIPMRVSFAPICGREGQVDFGIAVFDDILEERTTERTLAEQADQLARSNAELEQFAYVASHDLSEPLRTVAGFVQLLAQRYEGALDADADEFIGFALDGVKRMQALIQDLLTYSRVSRLEYTLEPVDTGALVADLAVSLGIGDAVGVSSPLPTVMADAGQLRRVFQNLISNALKFVPPERTPQVEVSAALDADAWRFSITDNGIGIAPQHRQRVFKMFQRLHSQDDYAGTGIGLAVCQRIVERHRGAIGLESVEGEGSTFSFTLPTSEDHRDR